VQLVLAQGVQAARGHLGRFGQVPGKDADLLARRVGKDVAYGPVHADHHARRALVRAARHLDVVARLEVLGQVGRRDGLGLNILKLADRLHEHCARARTGRRAQDAAVQARQVARRDDDLVTLDVGGGRAGPAARGGGDGGALQKGGQFRPACPQAGRALPAPTPVLVLQLRGRRPGRIPGGRPHRRKSLHLVQGRDARLQGEALEGDVLQQVPIHKGPQAGPPHTPGVEVVRIAVRPVRVLALVHVQAGGLGVGQGEAARGRAGGAGRGRAPARAGAAPAREGGRLGRKVDARDQPHLGPPRTRVHVRHPRQVAPVRARPNAHPSAGGDGGRGLPGHGQGVRHLGERHHFRALPAQAGAQPAHRVQDVRLLVGFQVDVAAQVVVRDGGLDLQGQARRRPVDRLLHDADDGLPLHAGAGLDHPQLWVVVGGQSGGRGRRPRARAAALQGIARPPPVPAFQVGGQLLRGHVGDVEWGGRAGAAAVAGGAGRPLPGGARHVGRARGRGRFRLGDLRRVVRGDQVVILRALVLVLIVTLVHTRNVINEAG
jgi:hypothetical protein